PQYIPPVYPLLIHSVPITFPTTQSRPLAVGKTAYKQFSPPCQALFLIFFKKFAFFSTTFPKYHFLNFTQDNK
ncbi:MAG: hypothetical protein IJ019_03975, partial [Alphaproteobacteria bacterium]|nr:hypothetical protein [Alphaproteobacteria bacterium]